MCAVGEMADNRYQEYVRAAEVYIKIVVDSWSYILLLLSVACLVAFCCSHQAKFRGVIKRKCRWNLVPRFA